MYARPRRFRHRHARQSPADWLSIESPDRSAPVGALFVPRRSSRSQRSRTLAMCSTRRALRDRAGDYATSRQRDARSSTPSSVRSRARHHRACDRNDPVDRRATTHRPGPPASLVTPPVTRPIDHWRSGDLDNATLPNHANQRHRTLAMSTSRAGLSRSTSTATSSRASPTCARCSTSTMGARPSELMAHARPGIDLALVEYPGTFSSLTTAGGGLGNAGGQCSIEDPE